jgi:hypothetical protein
VSDCCVALCYDVTGPQDPDDGDYTLIPVAKGLERPLFLLEVNDDSER